MTSKICVTLRCAVKKSINMKFKTITLPAVFLLSSLILFSNCSPANTTATPAVKKEVVKTAPAKTTDTIATAPVTYAPIDKHLYDSLMKRLGHGDTTGRWPVKNAPYPLPGAILPF